MAQTKDLEYYLAQARRIAEHREAGAEREIRKLYKSMLKELQTFISETYVKYAEDDSLTFAMLQKAGYDARFLEEVERRINVATPKAAQELRDLVETTYAVAWNGMVEGVAAQGVGGLEAAFADSIAITPEQIKAAVENPVSGLTLKDTLEKNRKEIIYSIKQIVGIGLMNGDRYTTMAKRIADQVDGDYTKAIRIARTETHRVREAGNHAAAMEVDSALQKGTTGMRMTKTWKTMRDERVRPQRRRKGKKGWSTKMGRGANHMVLHDQTVLEDEPFDLKDGNKAMMPGSSGVAGHDINCRCYASRRMMTDAEYFAATGKHFPGYDEAAGTLKNGTYVPADTKEEASEYAEKFFDVDADYTKYNIDVANAINETMYNVQEIFGQHALDELHYIGTFPKGYSTNWKGAYVRSDNPAMDGSLWLRNVGTKGSLEKLADDAKKQYSDGWWSTPEALHTIRHELGHAIHRALETPEMNKRLTDLRYSITSERMARHRKGDHDHKYSDWLSEYGMKNTKEFVAESVAEYLAGNPRETARKVIEILLGGK